jgi:hypothetical protein
MKPQFQCVQAQWKSGFMTSGSEPIVMINKADRDHGADVIDQLLLLRDAIPASPCPVSAGFLTHDDVRTRSSPHAWGWYDY